jgi:hypothetical protein
MAALPFHDETFAACAHLGDLKQDNLLARLGPAAKASLSAVAGHCEVAACFCYACEAKARGLYGQN